jgi:predicted AlkP superfamily pyrophosphatase or phosphodiesterase
MMEETRAPSLLVVVDGLRPDALEAACPQLLELRARGAWTMDASSVVPPRTLPCHLSLFHSVPPSRHGVEWNEWQALPPLPPTILDVAKEQGLRCSAIFNWGPLRLLGKAESLEFLYYRNTLGQADGDDHMVDAAIAHLGQGASDLVFVYLGTVDMAGHDATYMSERYLQQATRVDAALGRLIGSLPEAAHILVLSDHGGHDWDHGEEIPEDMRIPWILAGPSVRAGHEIASPVSLLDAAPTMARLLGLMPHPEWEGVCVDEAFA